MQILGAFLIGILFGVGLILSGMIDPSKIIGFLDVTGAWDPSLAFVMGGAVLVGALGFRIAERRAVSWFGGLLQLPRTRDIDRRLVLGSLTFGFGWGLAGFCPGPAVVAFGAGYDQAVVFVVAMLGGMAVYEVAERYLHRSARISAAE
jgi:uncharacterized membrane protein YedE/YeeE